MTLSSRLRGGAAVVMGLLITAAFGLFILIMGMPWRLLTAGIVCGISPTRLPNPFATMGKWWALIMHRVCTRAILQARVEAEGVVSPIKSDEVVLCVANHPSTMAVASFFWFLTSHLGPRVLIVAKREHLLNPLTALFVGLPLWVMRSGIFINRKNHASALAAIKRAVENSKRQGVVIVIFPDMRRPTPARIAQDCQRFARVIPGVECWLHHTLVPRSGGLHTLLTTLYDLGERPRVVMLTNAFNVADYGIKDASALRSATFHLYARTLAAQRIPRDQQQIKWWLHDWGKGVNRDISLWRASRQIAATR